MKVLEDVILTEIKNNKAWILGENVKIINDILGKLLIIPTWVQMVAPGLYPKTNI